MVLSQANKSALAAAISLHQAGNLEAAATAYREILESDPLTTSAYHNLGMILWTNGKAEEAEANFREALAINPNYATGWNTLGVFLREQQRFDEAIDCLNRAISENPEYLDPLLTLANLLYEVDRSRDALNLFQRVLGKYPNNADAYWGMGVVLTNSGEREEGVAALAAAARLRPESAEIRGALITERRVLCDWTEFYEDEHFILEKIRSGTSWVSPFVTQNMSVTAADQLACARERARAIRIAGHSAHSLPISSGKIRLGYLSCDFRNHVVANLSAELFERHDRARFEVLAYSYGFDDESEMRVRLTKSFDRFADLSHARDSEIARQIHADGVNILIDLAGYTGFARPEILAHRPAPIQVNYLGYTNTMGADFMDYIIADPFVIPPDEDRNYAEQVVRMPTCYQPHDTRRQRSAIRPTREQCGLPAGFVFCCFTGTHKITPHWFDIWMRLLGAVPDSTLWLRRDNEISVRNLCAAARARGIDPARLVFAPTVSLEDHLARLPHADLFLDTLPFGAHATMSDALWAGVPAITCVGNTFTSRVGGSLLRAVGLDELAVNSAREYEALALVLASNPGRLLHFRQKLALSPTDLPLFNMPAYTQDIEMAYSQMWRLYSAGVGPEPIDVAKLRRGI